MKKLFASLMLSSMLILPVAAMAQLNTPTGPVPDDPNYVFTIIQTLVNWLFYILIIAAIFIIIWAAFTFLTAGGDPEKVAKARNLILYAIVAIVVAFLAQAIIFLIVRIMGREAKIGF
ncbi:MAG: hypothetical protein Q8N69_03400 [bacterium]|nr:hypothetical protein [bacterium]